MAWSLINEAKAEAERRGWEIDHLQPEEIAFARGLPTLVCEDAIQGASLCLWIQEQIDSRNLPLATNRNIRLVQVFDIKTGKGPALAELARMLGIPNNQVLCPSAILPTTTPCSTAASDSASALPPSAMPRTS